MDDQVALQGWKAPNPSPECLMPSFFNEAFPSNALGDANEEARTGFEKHGLSVTVSSPLEEGQSLPLTPQFGPKSNSSSSLAERMQARAGFSVSKLSMPCIAPPAVVNSPSGAQSSYLMIPPGLSPTTLLESPVFLSNAMGQASPTTGKLLLLGGITDTDLDRIEGLPFDDGPDAFTFKPPVELKSTNFPTEEKKDTLPNDQHPSLPSSGVPVKTETNIHTAEDTNVLSHLNQQQFKGQTVLKSSSDDPKINRLAPVNVAGTDNSSPPDHGQPAGEGDAKGDYSALATATPAEDGYSWRKYGQKQVKHSEYPRSYYKCTHPNCQVKKKVERSHEGHITEIIYKGSHNHPKPPQSRRPGVPIAHPFGDVQMDAPDNPGSQANLEARPFWPNNVNAQDGRGNGLEAMSSPSVPGELCDSSASMQVQDGARFESPEGIDVSSAMSDEVDGDGRVTHGSISQGADAERDELESKRRKLESCAIEMSTASRAVREPRVVIQTTSEVDILDDGYRWRKYGQKVVKGNPNPRSYYKCTHPGCSVRKHVERASHDLKSVITTYEGKHNHEVPAARNSGHPASASGNATAAVAAASQAHAAARRPEPPPAQDGLMRLSSCTFAGLPPRDPLAQMSSFPYPLCQAGLPSLPMPAGLGPVDGLKLPMLAPPMHPFLRHHRPGMETAFMMPKGEVKEEVATEAGMLMPANGGGGGAAVSVYQQMMSRLPLRHQM